MQQRFVPGIVLILAAAACGGSGAGSTTVPTTVATTATTTTAPTTTTTQPGFTVTSEDGDLTVEVPFAALAEDPGITIRLLTPDEFPPELAGAAERPGARIYELEPDGLEFAAPVRVERRIDAANFGDLEPTDVPIVGLLTRSTDGTYQLLDDLHVMRSGDDLLASGELSHFSPIITVSEEQVARLSIDAGHTVFATEPGVHAFVGVEFRGGDGAPLNRPAMITPWARSRSGFLNFDESDSLVQIACTDVGMATPRIGFRVELRADAPPDQVGLRVAPLLALGAETANFLLKVAQPFDCLDPATSLIGRRIEARFQIDHPGGEAIVPGGDFGGGLSGAYAQLMGLPVSYIGLIGDANGNGILDLNDTIYQPRMTDGQGGDLRAVVPLYGYGTYFGYVVAPDSYESLPDLGTGTKVGDGLLRFCQMFSGAGRFETSIGVIGMLDGHPLVIDVGPGETTIEDFDARVLPIYDGVKIHF